MSLPLRFHPRVQGEVNKAYRWYEQQHPGLGNDFLAAIEEGGRYAPIEVQPVDPFTAELHNLVATINGEEQLKVIPAWGRHMVEVLLAAEESSRTGREVGIHSGKRAALA